MNNRQRHELTYFFLLSGYVVLAYVPFFFLSKSQMFPLATEGGFYQLLTAFAFLVASIYMLRSYLTNGNGNDFWKFRTRRNIFVLLMAGVFFIGAGEEESWGQHLVGFEPPEFFEEHNRQEELNLHNLIPLAGRHADGTPKSGLDQYLTISKLFSLFWLGYCVCIPLLAASSTAARQLLQRINIPIVPLWIGMVFPLNYLLSKVVAALTDADGHHIVEVKESNFSIMFLLFGVALCYQLKKMRQQERNGKAKVKNIPAAAP